MTIGELARQSSTPASTIRYWESVGVLPKPIRKNGQRRYQPEALHRLAVIHLAQSCGFELDEVRQLLQGFAEAVTPSRRWQTLATKKRTQLNAQIARLSAMRSLVDQVLNSQCPTLSECAHIAASGTIVGC